MGARHLRARVTHKRGARRGKFARSHQAQRRQLLVPRFVRADRKSLLLGTALASTFLFGSLMAPTPASAVQTCLLDIIPLVPINHTGVNDSINCLNFLPRTGLSVDAIALSTVNDNHSIALTNTLTGALVAIGADGIDASTTGNTSPITISNSGPIATTNLFAEGIEAFTGGNASPVTVVNSGPITTAGLCALGIDAQSGGNASPVTLLNSGLVATLGDKSIGLIAP